MSELTLAGTIELSKHAPSLRNNARPLLCRFLDAGMTNLPRAVAAGVQKLRSLVISGAVQSIEPGIPRFPDAQLRI